MRPGAKKADPIGAACFTATRIILMQRAAAGPQRRNGTALTKS
jgi:hypothetical protein